eukprot:TRINITY_DN3320_c0_g1_i1.p1 TRINITY_DN3320_c0_g1~~TRINITY_DN3320_c0_g1_i1.p1  ORF type:complete len:954 (+),score=178.24 TRINITY_DN3320_c0_g1_i1:251-3112(+)
MTLKASACLWALTLFLTGSAATARSESCQVGHDDEAVDDVAFVQRPVPDLTQFRAKILTATNTTQPSKETPAPKSLSPESAAWMALIAIVLLLIASFIQQRRYINIDDELTVEATEKTKRQAKQFIGLALAMDRDNDLVLFQQQNMMLACRAGVAAVGASLITFVPPLSDWFTQMGYEHKYACVLVLWCMGKSIGATISDLWDANVGTFLAFLFSFLLEGFYPGGFYEGDSPQKWMIGAGYTLVTAFIMMFGAWRNGVRVWCLSYHLGNMMAWLMPKEPGYVTAMSPYFHFTPKDMSFGYVVITLISSSICIMALSLPAPRMAHRLALRSMETSTGAIESLLWAMLKIYTGEAQGSASCNLQRTKLFSARLTEELGELSAHISASWWEHFDMGNFANVRRALGKHVIVSGGIQECISSMRTALTFEAVSNFKSEHHAIAKEISEPLHSMVTSAMALYHVCTKATKDGLVDEEEAQYMSTLIEALETEITEVTKTFKASAAKIGGEGFKQQHAALECDWEFVFIMCSLVRLIQDLGREHVSRKPRTNLTVAQAVSTFNIFAGMSDPDHLEFAIRNSLSLLLCFLVGYQGMFGLIPAYSSGIATNAALLLSTSVGSALKKNMGRVQGLVVGTTVGTLLYGGVTSGGCASASYFTSGILTTFVFSSFSFFMFLSTKEYSFVFYLFAGFGVQKLLHVCEPFPGDPALASYFVNILIAIVCVTILAAVDLSLSNSACSDAAKSAMELMKSISHSITVSLVDGEPQSDHSKAKIQSRLGLTDEKAFEGSLEPRLLSFPFQYEIYQALVKEGGEFLTNILTYRWAIRHSASSTLQDADASLKHSDAKVFELLQKCPSYKSLHDSFLKLFDELVISVESQVVARNAVESVKSTMNDTVDVQEVTANIVKMTEELGAVVAEANAEKVALDKDVEVSLHVVLSVMDNWCSNADTLQTTLQSSV